MNKPYTKPHYNKKDPPLNPNDQLNVLCQYVLLSNIERYNNVELEAKFGTKGNRQITKIDYDNVVKKLKSLGFTTSNNAGDYSLKIQSEFLDQATGEFKSLNDFDRFRAEITGISNIQEYCKTNDIKEIISKNNLNVEIMRKLDIKVEENVLKNAEFNDFNFRVSCKNENQISKTGKLGQEVLSNWSKSKKIFRYINRVSFTHYDFPFKIDLSIVRSSEKDKWNFIKTFNIEDSNIFTNIETYEIEIEAINDLAKHKYKNSDEFSKGFKKIATIVLCGLQNTNFPISYSEQNLTINEYMGLLHPELKKTDEYLNKKIYPNNFIGPNPITLQINNIGEINDNINIPNITAPYTYCVTEKADGIRHLLLVNNVGKIYLINTNMNVIFTGAKTTNESVFNTLLDGELILHDKNDKFINTFAAFDIYYYNSEDIRHYPFMHVPIKPNKTNKKSRLETLNYFINVLDAESINKSISQFVVPEGVNKLSKFMKKTTNVNISTSPIVIIAKQFYPTYSSQDNEISKNVTNLSIFEGCNFILQRIDSGLYAYNTDGLIFTPTTLGVGSNKYLEAGPLKRSTWEHAFKWKPAEFNTIDFLVTTKKGSDNNDIITPIFENGVNVYDSTQYNQYKTLVLRVGFNEKRDGYINPCQDLLDDKLPEISTEYEQPKPVQFFPTEPYDQQAGLCNVMLQLDGNMNYQMITEEGEVFTDNSIVEFKYDKDLTGLWRWKPLRVRYDKTAEYRQGGKNFGNAYNTANNNWYSIHHPITEKMISTGKNINPELISSDVYYNTTTSDKLTSAMRNFHNLFVKKRLIISVSSKGNTLIDLSCGRGGDFPKWISANLSFVFGIDFAKDGLENRLNGACARFLNYKKEYKIMPYALFVNGNSAVNIRSGKAMLSDKAATITKAVFGNGSKDKNLGPAVLRQFGKGAEGFNVSSCQFSMHYMLKNKESIYNFIQNISECTKTNGYFIGTCYDGQAVFNLLKNKIQGESIDIYEQDVKIWQITKDYSSLSFNADESSIGYQISVYQDSINQTLPEYLVNFEFFVRIMEDYGLVLLTSPEANKIGMPSGSGMFLDLYNQMLEEIKRTPSKSQEYKNAYEMRPFEKQISFLNRYFIFKKIRNVNAENITRMFMSKNEEELHFEDDQTKKAVLSITHATKSKPLVKKLHKKILLQEATEAIDISADETNVAPPATANETNVAPPATANEINVAPPATANEINVTPPATANEINVAPPAPADEINVAPPAALKKSKKTRKNVKFVIDDK